ncbi:hypothetical protein [Tsukamurella spumae]|uniref:Uncharacterized protein n=3 Tax=Tsukamurella TaxID=2060 RepID=A0A3P8L9W2_TSUPA|nr:hypothetical protein [Tsukamurella spumae]NKY18176.1 hypothetical protein [Tsukamurella spumae]VDR41191.1 Uncharacterised protein [Tsukamurella paurometabola]
MQGASDEGMSWKANWAVEREQRLAHLAALPGRAHFEMFDSLNRVSRLFSANGNELANHIGQFVGNPMHVNDLPDEFEHEAVRYFHNYIASVATLRDVQRSTHRRIWPERLPEGERRDNDDRRTVWERDVYESKVTELFGDDDIKFLFDLRNFTVHYSVPVMSMGTKMQWSGGGPTVWTNRVELKRSELDKYTRWGGPAKRFLRTQDDDVEFLPLLEKYGQRAAVFHDWFWRQVEDAVRIELGEYISKRNEFASWEYEENPRPDWDENGNPVPGSYRRKRCEAHRLRAELGTTGWGGFTVDPDGVAVAGETDWPPLPSVNRY